MSRKKLVLTTLIIMVFMCLLNGCMMVGDSDEEDTTETVVSIEEGNIQKAQRTIVNFVDAVRKQDYDSVLSLLYLPENAFIDSDDMAWYIPKSEYGDITGTDNSISDFSMDGTAVEKTAIFTIGKEKHSISLKLRDDNTWGVVLSNGYFENWNLRTPGGCTVTLDGKDLSMYKKEKIETTTESTEATINAYDTYTLPAITAREHTLSLSSSLYGEFTQTVTPKSSSDTYTMVCKINDAESENVLKCIMAIWNSIYEVNENEGNVPEIQKYFVNGYDTNSLTDILKKDLKSLKQGSGVKYSNFYMSEIKPWDKDNYGAVLLQGNNILSATFGYRLEFTDSEGEYHNANKVTTLYMAYEDSTYKIYSLNESKIFSENDYKNNDY